jgi:DNA replication and repair protein RecF
MINSLRLQNFRSYKNESFEFESGVNIVVGPNASGKTNLLEAVLVLATGGSYRADGESLIRKGSNWARIDGYFGKENRGVKLEQPDGRLTKKYLLADKVRYRLNVDQTIPVVLFEPNHLQILSRGPQWRRDYIDQLLIQTAIGYKTILNNYNRTLRQRNSLLKKGKAGAQSQLFAWDVRLGELGSQIAHARSNLVNDINRGIGKTYRQIAHKKTVVEVGYKSQIPLENYSSKLLAKLQSNVERDFLIGFTTSGPHRDDIYFAINDQPVSQIASRGENRSLILALKIFELGLIEKTRGQKPIFLLDDVFSELDGARRHALVNHLKNHQIILTTTDAEAVIEYFDHHKILSINRSS